jgi:hypothetical protein
MCCANASSSAGCSRLRLAAAAGASALPAWGAVVSCRPSPRTPSLPSGACCCCCCCCCCCWWWGWWCCWCCCCCSECWRGSVVRGSDGCTEPALRCSVLRGSCSPSAAANSATRLSLAAWPVPEGVPHPSAVAAAAAAAVAAVAVAAAVAAGAVAAAVAPVAAAAAAAGAAPSKASAGGSPADAWAPSSATMLSMACRASSSTSLRRFRGDALGLREGCR